MTGLKPNTLNYRGPLKKESSSAEMSARISERWRIIWSEERRNQRDDSEPPLPRRWAPLHIPRDTVSKNTAPTHTWSFTACCLPGSDLLAEPLSDIRFSSVSSLLPLTSRHCPAERLTTQDVNKNVRLSCTVSFELDRETLLNLNAHSWADSRQRTRWQLYCDTLFYLRQ